jgi:bifunctional non-homologous end joining protein LigD
VLGYEGIVSKRLGSPYRFGRSPHWLKVKNPKAPAV